MKALLERLAYAGMAALDRADGVQPGETVGRGAYGSPTSAVDALVETAILDALAAEGDPLNVLSEEAGHIDHGADQTLVLDPVDGTHNAVRGFPGWGISLAIGTASLADVEHGLVVEMPAGRLCAAEKGRGATLDGEPITTAPLDREAPVFLVALGTHAVERGYAVAAAARRTRHVGAACVDMSLIARGAADLYFNVVRTEAVRLRTVDVAAATLIVREAGGGVVDAEGDELDMDFSLEARSDVIAWGDARVREMLP